MSVTPRVPQYRRHRGGGRDRAFVLLGERRHYLGRWGSSESREKYHQLVAEWLAAGQQARVDEGDITVVEIAARFLRHAGMHYRRTDGTETTEVDNFRQAARPLTDLYGRLRAVDFGPLALKAVRESMIGRGWCRKHVNKQVSRVRMMFRWAVENELIPPTVHQALQAVSGLKQGRCQARRLDDRPVLAMDRSIISLEH